MARIRIEDLPPNRDRTPEELERIFGRHPLATLATRPLDAPDLPMEAALNQSISLVS
jgi:hypothetical protein